MAKTIEELEDKILSGDFDEYTLNEYNSVIRSDQRKRDIERACEWLREHVRRYHRFNTEKFKRSMEEGQ